MFEMPTAIKELYQGMARGYRLYVDPDKIVIFRSTAWRLYDEFKISRGTVERLTSQYDMEDRYCDLYVHPKIVKLR